MVETEATVLTDRQVEVLELRARGHTQREVAAELGTTDANVSAIERAAADNVEKARRTLELARTIRSPVRFTVPRGTDFDELVREVYSRGDEAGVAVAHCRPELYAHLYETLREHTDDNRLQTSIRVGLTSAGEVTVFTEAPGAEAGTGGDGGGP